LGQLRAVTQNVDLTKDAREFALLKKQREEEKAAQQGLQSVRAQNDQNKDSTIVDRKVIRKRITKTYPDGRQTSFFKFVIHPQEVQKIMTRLQAQPQSELNHHNRIKEFKYEHGDDETTPGHAMFEDEDDFEYSSKGLKQGGSRRRPGSGGGGGGNSGTNGGVNKIRRGATGRVTPRGAVGGNSNNSNIVRNLKLGKLKTKTSKEERMKKRKREEEELEVYSSSAKMKGTNNRRERGSIRERRPHVIFAEKLEQIRNAVEARPYAGPFLKPVNRRLIPRYYEVISHPIDLATIRDKIKR
jgi:Bromodomain